MTHRRGNKQQTDDEHKLILARTTKQTTYTRNYKTQQTQQGQQTGTTKETTQVEPRNDIEKQCGMLLNKDTGRNNMEGKNEQINEHHNETNRLKTKSTKTK